MKRNIITIVTAFMLFVGTKANAQIGNDCIGPQNPLTVDWEIPLNGHTFNLTENANTTSSLLVGFTACNPGIPARLGVLNDIHSVAGYFYSRTTNEPTTVGVYARATNSGTNVLTIGVHAEAEASAGADHVIAVSANVLGTTNLAQRHTGVNARAANGIWQSFAVNGDINNSSSPYNYGHQTEIYNSTSTSENYGYHGWVTTQGSANYGVYISASGATNNYGVYSYAPIATGSYAGYFNGDVHSTGTVTWVSDRKLKENIEPFKGASQILNKLNPVTFDFKRTSEFKQMNLPLEHQYGLIAQEVEDVLPTFVKKGVHPAEYDTLGKEIAPSVDFKSVNYVGLIPILVQGHKEQSMIIDSLETQVKTLNDRLSRLENCLNGILPALCQMSHNDIQQNSQETQEFIRKQITVYLSNKNSIILDQNVPNPFAEQTTINFSIPETVQKAQIQFFDGMGKLLQVVDIKERGLGSITVFGADLSSGTYSYTLVADGINVATKRMIKE